jgi:phage gp29-like protein
MGALKDIKNFFGYGVAINIEQDKKNMGKSVIPLQLQRIRQDSLSWRLAVDEAERAYFPFRVQMQTLYIDTILNGHVKACIDRRKDLTTLRDWQIVNDKGVVNEEASKLLSKKWFSSFIDLSLDSLFYGYSLISLGDMKDGKFKDIQTIKRWNISPDRYIVANVPYNTTGKDFRDKDVYNWHVYVSTINELGTSVCGYGLLYNVAIYEIFLRNILGYNGDFVELYSQPFRVGKTGKTEEAERVNFENAVANMGSAGYAILDEIGDSIEFMETAKGGNGWQGYDNLEQRLEKKISKLILGHADALDSVSGTLGATQGEDSPTSQALSDKKTKDGGFVEDIVNSELLPRLIKLGFKISPTDKFEFKNDDEVQDNNKKLIANAVEIKKAGLQVDKDYFEKQTGIKLSEVVAKQVPSEMIKNKIENLYK